MPDISRKVPSYRLHKSDGRAIVTINGRDCLLGKYGTPESREKYDRLITQWLASDQQSPTKPKPDITIVELIALFLTEAQKIYRQSDGKPSAELDC